MLVLRVQQCDSIKYVLCSVAKSCLTLCDPMDCSYQAPLSMEFSRQEYWSGLPFPSPGDLPDPGVEPRSPALQAGSLMSKSPGKPSSVTQSCLTLCDLMDCSMPGLPVLHQFLELAQAHVHQVSDSIQPSHPLSSTSPPTFNLCQHQDLFQ